MQHNLTRELTRHQYLQARLEEAFPDADEETLADTLEGLGHTLEMFADGGHLWSWHSDYRVLDSNE